MARMLISLLVVGLLVCTNAQEENPKEAEADDEIIAVPVELPGVAREKRWFHIPLMIAGAAASALGGYGARRYSRQAGETYQAPKYENYQREQNQYPRYRRNAQ